MAKIDPQVREATRYTAVWTLVLSVLMEAVFLMIGQWGLPVLFGNLVGAVAAVANIFFMGLSLTKAVSAVKPEDAVNRVKATKSLRFLAVAAVCVVFIAVFKTNVYATVIPLLFPSFGMRLKPLIGKGKKSA